MKRSPVRLLRQNPKDSRTHFYKVLRDYLESTDSIGCRLAVAYVTWGGLSLIADELEGFLQTGRTLETVFGIDNQCTTPDALLYSAYLRRRFRSYISARVYRWNYRDSDFHPKYFMFEFPEHTEAIVGSNNLTGGGLACNHELAVVVSSSGGSILDRECRSNWSHYFNQGLEISPVIIRSAIEKGQLAPEPKLKDTTQKALGLKLPRAAKPLFKHILDRSRDKRLGHEVLANSNSLTEKPQRLYLQVLEHETGSGYQIQLPVATLGVFFGVGPGEKRDVEFSFPELPDVIRVQLTHFENNTHRVRLLPLRQVRRPAILTFDRTAKNDRYECRVTPQNHYENVLRSKCPEQTREGSRRWGLS